MAGLPCSPPTLPACNGGEKPGLMPWTAQKRVFRPRRVSMAGELWHVLERILTDRVFPHGTKDRAICAGIGVSGALRLHDTGSAGGDLRPLRGGEPRGARLQPRGRRDRAAPG